MVLARVQHVRGTPRAGQEAIEPCRTNDHGDRNAGTKAIELGGQTAFASLLVCDI